MDCREARELLPWWVNETLDERQRDQVEDHLASCEACRAELEETRLAVAVAAQHLPVEALVAHAAGRDSGVDPELLATHLASCRDCAGEWSLLVESREALTGADVAGADLAGAYLAGGDEAGSDVAGGEAPEEGKVLDWRPPDRAWAGRVRAWRRGMAAATLAAAAMGLVAITNTRQAARLAERLADLEAPRANVALVDLYPDELILRTGDSATPPAELSASSGPATLILNSQQPPSSGPFRVEIRDPGGRAVAVIDGLRPDADGLLTLSLGTAELAGELILVLLNPASEPPEPLEAYRLRVR